MLNEHTHICIDPNFTTQPNLIYAKFNANFNLKIFDHLNFVTSDGRVIHMFDWERAFVYANVNEKVFIFDKIVFDGLPNFSPHKTLIVDDKGPSWFTKI